MSSSALARNAPVSGRKLWTFAKLYAAVRDLPEIIPLIGLVGATLGVAAYTTVREYGLAGDFFVSTELRKDMEKQIEYSARHEDIKPFVLWRVAQWRREDDGTIDVGIWPFHNKSWKYDHVSPHATAVHMPPDVSANQKPSPYPTEY